MPRAFDVAVLLLAGLTGPFAALLLPACAVRVLVSKARRRWYLSLGLVLLLTLAVQGWVVLHSHRTAASTLGAGLKNLLFLASDRVSYFPLPPSASRHTPGYSRPASRGESSSPG